MPFKFNPFTDKLDEVTASASPSSGVNTINTIAPAAGGNFTLTPGSGISLTAGTNSITIAAIGSLVNQQQIYYVAKSGNDANSGLNIENAVLTFGHAITLATAQTPSATNRFAIVCFDDGIYTEDISVPSYVDITAQNATLSGTLTVADSCNIKLLTQNAATGTTAITKGAGSTYSNVSIDIINCAGTANGCTVSTGFLNLTWKQLYIVDGYGIGDISVGLGHIHIKGGDIYISGTGIGVIRANTGSTVGRVDHILNVGGGTGSAIVNYGGTIDINVSKIDVTQAYNSAAANAIINLFVNEMIGTTATSSGGLAYVTTPLTPYSVANYTPVPFGSSPYTVAVNDYYIGCDSTLGVISLLLPDAPNVGRQFVIKDSTGQAGAFAITITTVTGTDLFDGSTSYVLNLPYQSITVVFNGAGYEVI